MLKMLTLIVVAPSEKTMIDNNSLKSTALTIDCGLLCKKETFAISFYFSYDAIVIISFIFFYDVIVHTHTIRRIIIVRITY